MEHINDGICECKHCTMLDCMWGDPKLTAWENSFVNSVVRSGWHYEYTPKQKAKIEEVFIRARKRYGVT
ncbi:hypothetical protein ES703_75290 [subsurface metagenome]